jgi:tol-pal system protein YbgF
MPARAAALPLPLPCFLKFNCLFPMIFGMSVMRHSSLLWLFCLLFLSACATRKEIANFKSDAFFVRAQLDSLRSGQQSTRLMLSKLQAATARAADSSMQWRERLYVKVEQMAAHNQFLRKRLDEISQQIANLPSQLRLTTSTTVSSPPAANKFSQVDATTADQRPHFPGSVRLYESAYQDLVKGKHEQAREGFMLYLRFLPQGELADEAQYWIGESYNGEGEIEKAMQAFQHVISNYPGSDKVPGAMFKVAKYQISLGQMNAGKKTFEALIERFPNAKESNEAQLRLRELQD